MSSVVWKYTPSMGATGTVDDVNHPRRKHKDALDKKIAACRLCPAMNIPGKTQSAPGFGSVHSPVVLVGQSLCGPCMKHQEPFYGGSGGLLDKSLHKARIAKTEVFITNVVHCHPPRNRESLPLWIDNCSPYLHLELEIVQPRLVIGLGLDAKAALRRFYPERPARELKWPFTAPRAVRTKPTSLPDLLFAKHPSWIKRQHDDSLEQEYVESLARALKWAFRDVPTRNRNV
jgi:DNA polymerase